MADIAPEMRKLVGRESQHLQIKRAMQTATQALIEFPLLALSRLKKTYPRSLNLPHTPRILPREMKGMSSCRETCVGRACGVARRNRYAAGSLPARSGLVSRQRGETLLATHGMRERMAGSTAQGSLRSDPHSYERLRTYGPGTRRRVGMRGAAMVRIPNQNTKREAVPSRPFVVWRNRLCSAEPLTLRVTAHILRSWKRTN